MKALPQLDSEQREVVAAINAEARNVPRKLRKIFKRSAVQVGLVEYNLRNRAGGDQDSNNWRQERESVYGDQWAKTGGPLNLQASMARYRQEFMDHYDPGEKAWQVAAQVQRPREDLRGRYRDVAPEARQILRQSGGDGPSGYSTTVASTPGIDNSALRQQALGSYLDERGKPGSLLTLAGALTGAQDVPGTTKVVRSGGQPNQTGGAAVGGPLYEMFYNGQGGVNVKNGKRVGTGFVSGHTDHVHVAGGPRSVVTLGKLAQRMGLTVRENEAFDKVDPVHTEGSYHYSNRAIDVSGDPKKMAAFSRRVARMYGV